MSEEIIEQEMAEKQAVKPDNVFDVRNSPEERKRVEEIIKTNNAYKGSKYMKPAFSVIGKPYN